MSGEDCRRGDLVYVPDGYLGIVCRVDQNDRIARVFLGNGLTADFRIEDLKFVKFKEGPDFGAANFAEIMNLDDWRSISHLDESVPKGCGFVDEDDLELE